MRRAHPALATLRQDQIIEGAIAVITEQGIQNLSLSEIEKKADMARGQLTYYFRTKEEILLAVFDRVLQRMYERIHQAAGEAAEANCPGGGWELVQTLLTVLLTQPPPSPEFGCLQHTFLAQISHRQDFRQRLATLYEQWRSDMATRLAQDVAADRAKPFIRPRAVATLVLALLHGLSMQALADPGAFDPREMLHLCLDMLGTYLGAPAGQPAPKTRAARKKAPARPTGRANGAARPLGAKR